MGMEVAIGSSQLCLMFLFVFINYRGVKLSGKMAERFRVLLLVGICCMDVGYDPQYRFFKLSAGNTDNIPGFKAWVEILTWICGVMPDLKHVLVRGRNKISADQHPACTVPRRHSLSSIVKCSSGSWLVWYTVLSGRSCCTVCRRIADGI